MHLEREEKYMEIRKADVVMDGSLYYLELDVTDGSIRIPLNGDNPNVIKKIFNKLILELKSKEFNYKLKELKDNLYYQISDEYIKQLNRELSSVHVELENMGMAD